MPWVALLEIFVTIVLAAGAVAAALHRWLAKLNHRLDKVDIIVVHIKEKVDDMQTEAVIHHKKLKRVGDIITLELSKNDGESTRDRIEHMERLLSLLNAGG